METLVRERKSMGFAEREGFSAYVGFHPVEEVTVTLRPSAAGEYADASQYPVSGENWDKVDEAVADDDATYIYSDTSGFWFYDLYELEDLPAGVGTITNVKVYARLKESVDGAVAEIWIGTNGDYAYGDEIDLTSSWANYSKSWATNPITGAAWTVAEINALQAGVLMKGYRGFPPVIPSSFALCTQIYVEVTYTP